jgi:hypothetical protein
MKKRLNTLNEEMDRIKSLFTEERMFGNLVEQEEEKQTSDTKLQHGTQKGGTGTDSEGTAMDKMDRDQSGEYQKAKQDTKSQRSDKFGDLYMKLDRIDIINNKAECKTHLKTMSALSSRGMTREDVEKRKTKDGKPGSEYIKKIEWCMSNFYNVFQKEGLLTGGRNDKIAIMMDTWKIPMPERVSGGVEGEKYEVKLDDGQKIAILKKVKPNQYRFRSALNIPLIDIMILIKNMKRRFIRH